ncbi:MAG TPA: hypothetical protein VK838_02245, partial [Candidatus Limnocylindrales bacterium]|nr:hypothetical protein [Candidatus Limnocylindrales bacterium]
GLAVAWPLFDSGQAGGGSSPPVDRETALVRHRLALEALRDVEADRRSGSLDEAAYAAQRAEAEAWALETLSAADAPDPAEAGDRHGVTAPDATAGRARGTALLLGAGLAGLLLVGFALPPPLGIGERTVTDQALADAVAAEDARQATIDQMLVRLQADPRDADALSALADAYLAGRTAAEQQRGAVALLALLAIEPDNASAYRRLITAYINAGDWRDAGSALDSYEGIAAAREPDIPFFRGLIALRGENDPAEAVRQFDRFLELAPHDARAGMVLTLREQAAEQAGGT